MRRSRNTTSKPTWSDIKAKLADFDRAGVIDLIGDLYSANSDNRTFLHARFALGTDPLKPYKDAISRWTYPNVYERQTYSVANAKKAVTDYRKAIGAPHGLAELMTFYCEQASAFCADLSMDDEDFYDALVRMFAQALRSCGALEPAERTPFLARLKAVRDRCQELGYGVGDETDLLWTDSPVTHMSNEQ
jgi:hypothetical protein